MLGWGRVSGGIKPSVDSLERIFGLLPGAGFSVKQDLLYVNVKQEGEMLIAAGLEAACTGA